MKLKTKDIILVGLFTSLTIIGAYIKIPIEPVPITLQIMVTSLAGIVLGSKLGSMSQLIYVLLGLIGIPVFALGKVGPGAVFNLSFGYSLGFIVAAYVIGKITEKDKEHSYTKIFLAAVMGTIIIYIIGVPYFYMIMNNVIGKDIGILNAIKTGCILFIPGDILKCIVVTILSKRILIALKK